jgi:ribosomal protein S18 acetylase RimI-like enzyme
MFLRPIISRDRASLVTLLQRVDTFTDEERTVALELIDEAIKRPEQSGYECIVAAEQAAGGDPDTEVICGYLSYGRTPMTESTYDLYWVAVDPAHRGKGLGRKLCQAFEEHCRQADGHLIRVETSSQEAYSGTLQFYLDTGYIEGGRLPDFYKPGDDLVILYKRV